MFWAITSKDVLVNLIFSREEALFVQDDGKSSSTCNGWIFFRMHIQSTYSKHRPKL